MKIDLFNSLKSKIHVFINTRVSLLILLFFLTGIATFGQTTGDYRTNANTAWGTLSTWQRWNGSAWVVPTLGEGYPGQFAVPALVTVQNNNAITLDVSPANNIGSLVIAQGVNSSSLTFTGTSILTVNNAVTINDATVNGFSKTIAVGGGTLTCASLVMSVTGGDTRISSLTISTGTVTVTGAVTLNGTAIRNVLSISSTGTLNVAGAFTGPGSLTTASGSTVNYNGAAQTAKVTTYHNLTLSGSLVKTFATTPTVNGVLSMEGTATVTVSTGVITYGPSATLQYNTATSRTSSQEEWLNTFAATGGVIIRNTGTITLDAAKQFGTNTNVPLTIDPGATFSTSASNFGLTFHGNFINNGTLTAGSSAITIAGTTITQSIGGFTTTGTVSMIKTGGTATFTGNVNGTGLTISGSGGTLNLGLGLTHTFTGTWTRTNGTLNGGSSSLKLGGGFSGTGGTFTANAGTVEWNAAGAQALPNISYNNLVLSGSGNKTFPAVAAISGNLSISGSAVALLFTGTSNAATLTLSGSGVASGTWGGSTSGATYKSSLYFGSSTTGIITVSTGSCATPNVSNFTAPSATSVCPGNSSVVTVNSSSLANGTYTITYNVSGTNTVSSTTASMVFSGGTGTFTTAALPSAGNANVVNITAVTTTVISCTNSSAVTVSTPAFSTVVPDVSNLSATASSSCGSTTVSVSSATLTTGSYTVTYNVSGTNTVSSTTAVMSFTAGAPGTGTFNTATLNTSGSSNVVTITSIQNNSTSCSSATSTSTPAFTTTPSPNVSSFSISSATTSVGQGAVVTVSSTSLETGNYTITYTVSGTNTISSTTATINYTAGILGSFTTAALSNAGGSNVVNVSSIKYTATNCSSAVSASTPAFTTVTSVTTTTISDGNWQSNGNWDNGRPGANDIAIVRHALTGPITNVKDLTVESAGSVDGTGDQLVSGNFTVDGSYTTTGKLTLSGVNTTIAGTGIVYLDDVFEITVGNKFIAPTANLAVTPSSFNIVGAFTVTNQGEISIASNVTGSVAGSTWTNAPGATVNVSAAFLTTGTLNASAAGNTVNYYGSANQAIKTPTSVSGNPTYYTLEASGTGTKTLPAGTLAVNGNIIITSTLADAATTLRLGGSWTNDNVFTRGTGSVVLVGTSAQTITCSVTGGETFNNLTVNNASGITLGSDVTVATTLTFTSGIVNTGTNKLILGTTNLSIGSLSGGSASSYVIGIFERRLNATGTPYLFPIGATDNGTSFYRPATITFDGTGSFTAGSLAANFNVASPGSSGLPITNDSGVNPQNTFADGYWSLTTSNSLTSNKYNLSLAGTGFTAFSVGASTRLLTRANSAAAWLANGSHVGVAGATVTRNGITQLSGEYCFADNNICTPPVAPVITISNPNSTSICNNVTGQIFNATPNNYSPPTNTYTWNVTGGTIQSGTGTNQITVNWISSSTTASVSVYETSTSCTRGPAATQNITLKPVAPTAISGSLSVPQTTSYYTSTQTYSIPSPVSGYTYNWTVTGGTPTSGTGNSISVTWGSTGTGRICLTATDTGSGCVGTSAAYCKDIEIYSFVYSTKSGNFSTNGNNSIWNCGCNPIATDNVIILAGDAVSLNVASPTVRNLTIVSGGSLNLGTNTLTVSKNITVNGATAVTGTGGTLNLSGNGATIDGIAGTIATTTFNMNGNASVSAFATLTRTGDVNIAAGKTITNNGIFTVNGSVIGGDAASSWVNSIASTLNVSGALLNTGILDASATGNTVAYTGAAIQSLKTPASSYNTLSFSGAGEKTAPATLNVNGNFINAGTAVTANGVGFNHNNGTINFGGTSTMSGASVSSFNVLNILSGSTLTGPLNATFNVKGNLDDDGTFTPNGSTVNFNGTSTLTGTSATNFNNVVVATGSSLTSSAGTISMAGNFTNNGTFANNNGTINFNGTSLMAGTSQSSFNSISIANTSTLTGPLNATFNVKGNFIDNGTFTHNNSTMNFNGTSALTGASTTNFYNLIVANASTLTSSSGTISIAQDFTNNGTFAHNNGIVNFNGTTQSITGTATTDFNNVTIRNTSGLVSMNANANLYGELSLPLASSAFDADGAGSRVLTLVSTSDTQAGSIGLITTPNNFSGNVTVQRFMSAKGKVNRYISMPASGMVLNTDLSELGLPAGGFIYNETLPGSLNSGWTQTGKSYSFTTGLGFLAYNYNNVPITWEVRGNIHKGPVALPITFTSTGNLANDGWNLVGNPYPSSIQWNNTSDWTGGANVDNVVYVSDLGANVFRTWDRSTGLGSLTNGNIALGQAFWVHANNTSPSLTVNETAKKNSPSTFFRKKQNEIPELKLALSNGSVEDYAFIFLKDSTTSRYDKGIDALKLEGNLMGISLFSDDQVKLVHYSTNQLPDKEIPLNVMSSEEGTFSIYFESTVGADEFQELYLLDRYTHTIYPIANDKPYEFAVTENALTKEGRFFLSKKASMEEMTEVRVSMFPNPVAEKLNIEINTKESVPVTIYQMSGNSILETTLESRLGIARATIDVKELPTGLYFIKTVVDGQIRVDKVIKR